MSGKVLKYWKLCIGIVCLLGISAAASGEVRNAGVYTGEDTISIYVKGLDGKPDSVSCQIGKKDQQQVSFEFVEDMNVPAKTLIMLDNSLSITKENREKIETFLKEYVYEKDKEELVAIATFSEEIDTMTEYIADRRALEDIIDTIEYNDQETYLTDVLYDAVAGGSMGEEDCYKKVIIISDGVDNKSIGYTKEELYSLIKEKQYPIYALGCKYNKNDEKLENMFALSRITGAVSCILDDCEDVRGVVDSIIDDSTAVHFIIKPEEALLDGGNKNVLLTIGSVNINAEVQMPFKAEAVVETQVAEPETVPEEPQSESQEPEEEDSNGLIMIIVLIVAAVLALAVMVTIIIVVRKKKNAFEVLSEPVNIDSDHESGEDDKTVLVNNNRNDDDRSTQMIWSDSQRQYNLILTDVKNPARTFQIPISGNIVIGRKSGEANVVIDYDKSVSGKHCQIREQNGKFYVRDLNSSNGTKVNDSFVLSDVEIYSGCRLTIGRLVMKVEIR